ncbi:hypothetical protein [Chelativorans salis]|uniref:Uncharacterized protein n=1 Tax=Chelativorans salis TaxID=2978478 RepID=A0ABT2LLW5_9HYPH|nr:hypothetical protein [Chelativorans sp. EGI FJ00035]MCT7375518.1 hypothetical protein [Chelativorans sp. EGI FJ00035]
MANNNSVSVKNTTIFDPVEFGNSAVEAAGGVGGNSNDTEKSDEGYSSGLNGAKRGDVNIDFAVSTPDSNGTTGSEEDRLGLQVSATTSSEGSLDWNVSSNLGELTPLGSEMSGVNAETTNDGTSSVSGHATVVGEEALGAADNADIPLPPQVAVCPPYAPQVRVPYGPDADQSPAPEVTEFRVSLGVKYGPDADLEFLEPETVTDLSDVTVQEHPNKWWLSEQPDYFYQIDFELDGEKISILMGDEAMQELTQSPEKVSELIEEQWQALEAIRESQPSNADADQVPDSSEQAPELSEEITHDDLFSDTVEDTDFAPGFEFDVLSPSDLDPLDLDEGLPFLA